MALLDTKYSIGEKVWYAGTKAEWFKRDCPDCFNRKKWKAMSPAGTDYEFNCPRCSSVQLHHDELSLNYQQFVPFVRQLTIGSIKFDTHDEDPVKYMCSETGIGAGSVYKEIDLFPTEEQAICAAQAMADENNSSDEWVSKKFDRTLDLKDYELLSCVKREDHEKLNSLKWKIFDLIESIYVENDIDQIKKLIEDFRNDN